MGKIKYFGTEILVGLGDAIRMKRWFREVEGTIVYVPGVSSPNKFFGVGVAAHVGVRTSDSRFYGVFVSEVGELKSTVTFCARGDGTAPELPCDLDDPGISTDFCQ